MTRIMGITTQKIPKDITKAIIDVNTHREIIAPLLAQLTAKENDTFEKEWSEARLKGSSIEDVFGRLEAKIRS